jgi:hypothetical protein
MAGRRGPTTRGGEPPVAVCQAGIAVERNVSEAALARNDRYLREFVEALELCPFARRCRESGRLVRRVVLGDAVTGALGALAYVSALPEEACEVALLLFPEFTGDLDAFREVCAQVRARADLFHCVAFHPDLPMDLADGNRAVSFLRRSPDPTLQLVRIATLDRVRRERAGGSVYVDPARLASGVPEPQLTLSDQIARANLRTLQRHDPAELARLLASMRP